VIALTGTDLPLVAGIAAGLGDHGATVATVPTGALGSRADTEAALGAVVAEHGPLAGVVHAAVDPIAYEPVPMAEVDDARFDAVWEQTMLRGLFVLQAAHAHLRGRGGGVVVITPVIGMAGAAEHAPYAAALEGLRILAKSAARQWGADGIRVNVLAPAPEHVPVGVTSGELALSPPALGGPGDARADLGPITAWLLSDGAHFLTGATLAADGGVWMAP
jgi:3-oxoacyl-[acyl-carrier protein] reductase